MSSGVTPHAPVGARTLKGGVKMLWRSPARVLGVFLLGLWGLLGLSAAYAVVTDFATYGKYFVTFVRGAGVTLSLVGLSVLIGAVASLPIALGRMSRGGVAQTLAYWYVYFFRGTPLIAQIFLVYYGFGSFREALEGVNLWWLFRDPFYCALLVFSMNTAAYQAEILRGAIESVPRGQREAGVSLGLPRLVIFWKITLPQALIIALRPYGNEIILMIKGSAIVAIITVFDLMGETRRAFSRTFDYNTYLLAAMMYLAMVEVLRRLWDRLEERLTRHLRR